MKIASSLIFTVLLPAALSAAPTSVTITPPDGARFAVGQRFDLRVEGAGTGPYQATLALDGTPLAFTSGAQNTNESDGVTTAGFGGFNLRGYSSRAAGPHILSARFTDATGSVEVRSRFEIVRAASGGSGIKNVILFLGDGMGVAHRTAARIVQYGVTAGQPNGLLAMDRFPGSGLVTTHSLNSIVTDSAPGMAAYVTGNHFKNGQEGVYPAHMTSPFFYPRVEYLAEYLHRTRGTALGLVTTADVEDATPAANAVHVGDRAAGTGICDQYLDESDVAGTRTHGSGLAVLMGGGRRWFAPKDDTHPYSSRDVATDYPALPDDLAAAWKAARPARPDPERDLLADFRAAGFAYVDSATALAASTATPAPDRLLGLFAWGNMNVALDKLAKRRGTLLPGTTTFAVDDYHAPDQPMLEEMTEAALRVLSHRREGFYLMVEGAHIDKQSHLMDADRAIGEVLELDRAVAAARRFADARTDTLVLVVSDHETAGFSVIGALTGGIAALEGLPSDTEALAPAAEPARQKAVGTYDAAGFPRYALDPKDGYPESLSVEGKVLVGFGAGGNRFETWLTPPRPLADTLQPGALKTELAEEGYVASPAQRPEPRRAGMFLRGQVGGEQAVHTASDVPIAAFSRTRAWERFLGVQTNTDVFFKILAVMTRS